MVNNLRFNGKSKPTRRVWIPKPNGEQRPLGIPTIEERAKQCLVKLALEPQWEAKFEVNSYGFRPARSGHDAIEAIFNAIKVQPKYVLDADIAKCFDKIDHNKLLAKIKTYPILSNQIKAWLKSGVIDKSWTATEEGTPQGGVVSPLLANIALHGMELEIEKYASTWKGKKRENRKSISLVRYADDFVILHKDLKVVLKCKEIIENWLRKVGLELKPSKTRISHTFNTIIKPSNEKVKAHIQKLNETIRKHKSSPQTILINNLNPIIRGWSNYYSAVCSKETFSHCDHILYLQLKRWAERRHPMKSKKWVKNKYWHTEKDRNWVFGVKESGEIIFSLTEHNETPIVRHTKVKGNLSPFDGDFLYWSSRRGKYPGTPSSTAKMLKSQKGKCNYCGLYFKEEDLIEKDHIIPTSKGGKDTYKNLQLLHRHCHDKKSRTDGSYDKPFKPIKLPDGWRWNEYDILIT